ncbi:MAG: putative HTH-type transcriptional regulator YdfH [Firmicutes bacterium ADurb.Bin356]|nr:MAG: putative HTH-type transcriptional regulator YdfH [Firmicutes bacterium ADurb.Bin356]
MDNNDFLLSGISDQDANSLTLQIYNAIKLDILFGRLEAGFKLNSVHLAKQFNVSRTPVKQALELLKREYLIEAEPGKQAVVRPPSKQDITTIYFLRKQLEPHVAKASVNRIPKNELLKMKTRLKELEANPLMHADHIEFDNRLHSMLWKYLKSPVIDSLFQVINDYSVRMQSFITYSLSLPSTNNSEHMAIIEAALARDGESIFKSVEAHLAKACRRLIDYYDNNHLT